MKIGVAQIQPSIGDIPHNIDLHKSWIEIAVSEGADVIAFPELSLTGYAPQCAGEWSMDKCDPRLDVFQRMSDFNQITIGIGLPTLSRSGTHISMVLFQPRHARTVYSKQYLHSDELPFFKTGKEQLVFTVKSKSIAPAICYESLLTAHSAHAKTLGAEVYLTSVAKPKNKIDHVFKHYPRMAKAYSMPVLMANSIGFCDNFMSAGQSAVWNKQGKLLAQLGNEQEGLLLFDTETGKIKIKTSESIGLPALKPANEL